MAVFCKGDFVNFNFTIQVKVSRPFEVENSEVEQYLTDCLDNFIFAKQEEFNK